MWHQARAPATAGRALDVRILWRFSFHNLQPSGALGSIHLSPFNNVLTVVVGSLATVFSFFPKTGCAVEPGSAHSGARAAITVPARGGAQGALANGGAGSDPRAPEDAVVTVLPAPAGTLDGLAVPTVTAPTAAAAEAAWQRKRLRLSVSAGQDVTGASGCSLMCMCAMIRLGEPVPRVIVGGWVEW